MVFNNTLMIGIFLWSSAMFAGVGPSELVPCIVEELEEGESCAGIPISFTQKIVFLPPESEDLEGVRVILAQLFEAEEEMGKEVIAQQKNDSYGETSGSSEPVLRQEYSQPHKQLLLHNGRFDGHRQETVSVPSVHHSEHTFELP